MRFKLLKSVSGVLISNLVVLLEFGEDVRYVRNPHKALLPYMRLYKWLGYSHDRD